VLNAITVVGSIVGTRVDLAETFELHAAGKTKVLYETRRLEEVNEVFEEVEHARNKSPRLVFSF
jgi:propanol-preferring alcohol dehydrogenase